ncbi:hypothetical protein GOBAR_AA10455 [Gossypium barbadense]|uniref:Uncharacterized protein n=1 Tax=Gossypium barbadense TaxID=3634 RepID=A0A2P5Y3S7_GOSBA|nr:hypothetical protein GOBAR_AA10455 [Gossypium barbadense]
MPNAVKFLKELLANKWKLDEASHKTGSKNTYEPCSSNIKGPIYKERRLVIEELDEWRTYKPRTHHNPKPSQDEINTSPNQLKVGDKVLLDATDPRIATSEPNGEIPLMVLSIFSNVIVEVMYPKFGTFKWAKKPKQHGHATQPCLETVVGTENLAWACDIPVPFTCGRHYEANTDIMSTRGKKIVVPSSKKRKGAASSSGIVQFHLGGLVHQLSILEDIFHRYIHYSPSKCWNALVLASATYDPSRSKALTLPPFLRKGFISIGPYVTRLAQHFGVLNTAAESSSLTLIGQMSSQGISTQSIGKDDPEDITDDVPPHHEDPSSQPPPPHRPVHAAASYSDISKLLT